MKRLERDVEAGPEDKLFNRSSLPQGVSGEPAKLSPVQWDKLPKVSPAGRTRLATPAPGTEKGSGLVDISALLAQHKQEQAAAKAAVAPAPAKAPPPPRARQTSEPRLATAAKAGGGSGLIELDAIREAVRQSETAKPVAPPPASSVDDAELPSFAPSALTATSTDSLYVDEPTAGSSQRLMLLGTVGLLLVVLGLLGYVAST